MSGTYVSQNGTGEFEIRPFQLEQVCQANNGHSHNYDHWMRVLRGDIELSVYEPSTKEGEEFGELIGTYKAGAGTAPTIPCIRANGETYYFHLFVDATKWHKVKALTDNVAYECVFLHRDFETGEVVQQYNGNPLAAT